MKLTLLQWSVLANLVLLVATVALGWRLAQAKPECALKQAGATGKANVQLREEEGKRDKQLGHSINQYRERGDLRELFMTAGGIERDAIEYGEISIMTW